MVSLFIFVLKSKVRLLDNLLILKVIFMLFYFFMAMLSLAAIIFFGSIIVMSILSIIGFKYKANLGNLSIWGAVGVGVAILAKLTF